MVMVSQESERDLTDSQHPCTKVRDQVAREMSNATADELIGSIRLLKTKDDHDIRTEEKKDGIGDAESEEEHSCTNTAHVLA